MQDEFIDDQPPIGTLTDEARASLAQAIAATPADHPDKVRHTPGPWNVNDGGTMVRNQQRLYNICDCSVSYSLEYEEMAANARLIALAPCLLEALIEVLDAMQSLQCSLADFAPKAAEKARAAIAKATYP